MKCCQLRIWQGVTQMVPVNVGFAVPAYPGSPRQRDIKRVCVSY